MFAIIKNKKVIDVVNLDTIENPQYEIGAYVWDTGGLNIQIGDDLIDGIYYREGQVVRI